jgi:hypothetical protein
MTLTLNRKGNQSHRTEDARLFSAKRLLKGYSGPTDEKNLRQVCPELTRDEVRAIQYAEDNFLLQQELRAAVTETAILRPEGAYQEVRRAKGWSDGTLVRSDTEWFSFLFQPSMLNRPSGDNSQTGLDLRCFLLCRKYLYVLLDKEQYRSPFYRMRLDDTAEESASIAVSKLLGTDTYQHGEHKGRTVASVTIERAGENGFIAEALVAVICFNAARDTARGRGVRTSSTTSAEEATNEVADTSPNPEELVTAEVGIGTWFATLTERQQAFFRCRMRLEELCSESTGRRGRPMTANRNAMLEALNEGLTKGAPGYWTRNAYEDTFCQVWESFDNAFEPDEEVRARRKVDDAAREADRNAVLRAAQETALAAHAASKRAESAGKRLLRKEGKLSHQRWIEANIPA